jgi:hypothetical protein
MTPAPYYVENVFEALEKPGEFYYHRARGKIYYIPRPGESLATAEAIMPRQMPHLVLFEGKPETGRFVEYLELSGLAFSHTEAARPPRDWPGDSWRVSGALTTPAAIHLVGARNCAIENGEVAHVGGYAIELGTACTRNRIVGNEIYDLGAGGIKVGTRVAPADPHLLGGDNAVTDNHLHDAGRIYHSLYGIQVGHSNHDTIAHNHIHHLPYIGILSGMAEGAGKGTVIEANHIHHIGLGMLSDLAGIYTIDRHAIPRGVIIRNNIIHDVEPRGYGGWGIYFDSGTTGVMAENNIVYRCKSAGFHMRHGNMDNLGENIVRNNIFALSHDAQIARSSDEPQVQFGFEGNIVYWREGALLTGSWGKPGCRLGRNIYWNPLFAASNPEQVIRFGSWTLAEWRQHTGDLSSIIADPHFVDPDKGDFTLKPDSPALKLGFSSIDVSSVGPRPRPPSSSAKAETNLGSAGLTACASGVASAEERQPVSKSASKQPN